MLILAVLGCGPSDPFTPAVTCEVRDEAGSRLFAAVHLEGGGGCDSVNANALRARELLATGGFVRAEDFPRFAGHVTVWIHAGERLALVDDQPQLGAYEPGAAPRVRIERRRLSWVHELLHHFNVETLAVDPEVEALHRAWQLDPGQHPSENPYVEASDRFYWERLADSDP